MVRIRIGNDIPIRWAVTRCGVPEDFAGKSLRLYMRTAYSETEVTDFAVNGNVLSWTFPGAAQKATGTYTFTLVENEGLDDMATVDACDALKLVACTCSAECAESVEISSDIDVPANGRTPVFETGETETLDPGSPATSEVELSGRDEDGNPVYRLNFGVPEGQPGKTPVFSAGQTVTGEPGTQASAKVDEDGTDEQGNPKYKIALTIPRGDTGKTPVIVQQVNVTTLAPGSQATASIAQDGVDGGGNPKYVLSVGIPQGAKGDAFEYSDFTPEQIAQLQQPATEAAETANTAAGAANVAAEKANTAAGTAATAAGAATTAASAASSAASSATEAAETANTAASAATAEAGKATSAASAANSAASAATQTNTQVAQAESQRVSAEQQRAAAEQTRQQQFTEAKEAAESAAEAAQEAADNITTPLDVLAHSDCTLEEKVTTLAQLIADICEGRVTLPSLNVKRLGVWGENNLIVTGSGAPLTPPDRAGQIYIDTTNNAQYNSTGNNSVSDWKIQN